jgi:hypothetical protein
MKCSKCGQRNYWGHGWYFRKGTHFSQLFIPIHRYKCQTPGCGKTIPLRPFPILPYCRFSLLHLIQIEEHHQAGIQPQEIAKGLELRMPVVLHILKYLKRIKKFIKQEFRTFKYFNETDFLSQWIALIKEISWLDLSMRYFHHIFPKRYAGESPHTIR